MSASELRGVSVGGLAIGDRCHVARRRHPSRRDRFMLDEGDAIFFELDVIDWKTAIGREILMLREGVSVSPCFAIAC